MDRERLLFVDIETLPAAKSLMPKLKSYFVGRRKREGKSFTQKDIDGYHKSSSLLAEWGRVLCVGWARGDQPAEIIAQTSEAIESDWQSAERKTLSDFWRLFRPETIFVGHNIFNFDLPFLIKRSIIHRIRPPAISFHRYRSDPIFDTMLEWNRWAFRSSVSLDLLAQIFDLESSKKEIDGSRVYQAFKAGKLDLILDYCRRDVELTRAIYDRLNFSDQLSQNSFGDSKKWL